MSLIITTIDIILPIKSTDICIYIFWYILRGLRHVYLPVVKQEFMESYYIIVVHEHSRRNIPKPKNQTYDLCRVSADPAHNHVHSFSIFYFLFSFFLSLLFFFFFNVVYRGMSPQFSLLFTNHFLRAHSCISFDFRLIFYKFHKRVFFCFFFSLN